MWAPCGPWGVSPRPQLCTARAQILRDPAFDSVVAPESRTLGWTVLLWTWFRVLTAGRAPGTRTPAQLGTVSLTLEDPVVWMAGPRTLQVSKLKVLI